MKKTICMVAGIACLAACQQNECLESDVSDASLRLEAEVATSVNSRTATSQDGKVTFEENDQIGFYMPQAAESGLWTYSGGSWNSSVAYEWKDKVNDYTFCAYYPYQQSAPRTNIPMPDLSKQNGDLDQIGKYDFLASRCTTNFSAKNGVVSFTGSEAMKHIYALVSVTVKKEEVNEDVTIADMNFEAPGLFTSHEYHFGAALEEDGMTANGESVDLLSLQNLSASVPTEGYNRIVVVNPVQLEQPVNFSIKYNRDQINYTASTTALGRELKQGHFYKLTLRLKKSGLIVEGNTVEDWNIIPLDDIDVEENPVE